METKIFTVQNEYDVAAACIWDAGYRKQIGKAPMQCDCFGSLHGCIQLRM